MSPESPIMKRELDEWHRRVFFDADFKPGRADLDHLREIFRSTMEKFTIISSSSEISVYKMGKFFVRQGMSNQQITFIDGRIVSVYISPDDPNDWSKRKLIDNFIELYKRDIKNKMVFIPILQNQWDTITAIYFITQLKYHHAMGAVFYSEGPNNLGEILVQGSDMMVHEFPEKVYGEQQRTFTDDGW